MGQPINIVGQQAMDNYYSSYKSSSQFFTLDDFVRMAGNVLADAYQKEWDRQQAEMRAERKDELVTFDPSWLNEEALPVKFEKGIHFSELPENYMSFLSDKSVAGIQFVFSIKPTPGVELERLSLAEKWQNQYAPFVNRVFFTPTKTRLIYTFKGNCKVTEVNVLYVPAISETMEVPEGLVFYAISQTVQYMKAAKDGTIVKKTIDNNQNMVMETEINKLSLK